MRRILWILCIVLLTGVSFAGTWMSDTFSWGTSTSRLSSYLGSSIAGLAAESNLVSGTWAVTGSAVFINASGYGNGGLRITGGNPSIRIACKKPVSTVALRATGYFTPGTTGTRGFYVGLQTNANESTLLVNQAGDKIYGSINHAGAVSLVAAIGNVTNTASSSIVFSAGDVVNMVLIIQKGQKCATLTVNGSELTNRTEISIQWPGLDTDKWCAFAVNSSGSSEVCLTEAGYYQLPSMPGNYPRNMSFRGSADQRGNGTDFDKVTNNYSIHHGDKSDICDLKSEDPSSIAIQIAPWTQTGNQNGCDIWPGHLLYYQGTRITQDLTASSTDTKIYVADTSCFQCPATVAKDHVIIYPIVNGSPDWANYEYAKLTNMGTGWIQVQRATSGSTIRSFVANQAAVAPHVAAWVNQTTGIQQWVPNFSLHAPVDPATGKQAWEVFSEKVAGDLLDGSPVTDGVEHDMFYSSRQFNGRPLDCNNDLTADWGYIGGVSSFCLGIQRYAQNLRDLVGPDKIIQFDSSSPRFGYRGWKYVNGCQIEAFMGYKQFSVAMEHLSHWVDKAQALPSFSYGFTKEATELYGTNCLPGVSGDDWRFRVHFAGGLMNGMPTPYVTLNINGAGLFDFYEWDEYNGGTLRNKEWLGAPIGSAVRDASGYVSGNLISTGAAWSLVTQANYTASMDGSNYGTDGFHINVTAIPDGGHDYHGVDLFMSNSISLNPGEEYTLVFKAQGDDRWVVGSEVYDDVPRLIDITAYDGSPGDIMSVLADAEQRTYTLSYLVSSSTHLFHPKFGVGETIGNTWIKDIKLYKGTADRWSREFDNGKVFLNMSQKTAWTVTLDRDYWRLKSINGQTVNNGQKLNAGSTLVIPVHEAVFLSKTQPPAS